jgi:hypothetical protein
MDNSNQNKKVSSGCTDPIGSYLSLFLTLPPTQWSFYISYPGPLLSRGVLGFVSTVSLHFCFYSGLNFHVIFSLVASNGSLLT